MNTTFFPQMGSTRWPNDKKGGRRQKFIRYNRFCTGKVDLVCCFTCCSEEGVDANRCVSLLQGMKFFFFEKLLGAFAIETALTSKC